MPPLLEDRLLNCRIESFVQESAASIHAVLPFALRSASFGYVATLGTDIACGRVSSTEVNHQN